MWVWVVEAVAVAMTVVERTYGGSSYFQHQPTHTLWWLLQELMWAAARCAACSVKRVL